MATTEDNWKHRSQEMRCRTCMYFVVKKTTESNLARTLNIPEASLGRCRRHAPTLRGWPAIFTQDWCGDHKLDENKI